MTPFDMGYDDAERGLSLHDNPFNRRWSPAAHEAWMRGWWGCHADHDHNANL